jgi:DNA invertase Pin-like site-specific DNA recombinase
MTTDEQNMEIAEMYSKKVSISAISRMYKVSRATVARRIADVSARSSSIQIGEVAP